LFFISSETNPPTPSPSSKTTFALRDKETPQLTVFYISPLLFTTPKYSLSLLNDINHQFERLFANRERSHRHLKQDAG
jgi:hypothetical protein